MPFSNVCIVEAISSEAEIRDENSESSGGNNMKHT
jgi:hypothetical protein